MRALLISLAFLFSITACAPQRAPIPPGVVPEQSEVSAEDEQYGHQVLNQLMERYELDNDDARINRVRDVADKLTAAKNPNGNPWHVYVLKDSNFKNAAATRGNYIFVWTGMLETVQNDDELATIIAHEIGHVLAGHTNPDPSEEVTRIIAGIAGEATGHVVAAQGTAGILASLAASLVKTSMEALLVNPSLKRQELEADQLGLFLMADAGFNPEAAVRFWERVQHDPNFSGFPLAFLSSHPSSTERFERLRDVLPLAEERYRGGSTSGSPEATTPSRPSSSYSRPSSSYSRPRRTLDESWVVVEAKASVRSEPRLSAKVLADLPVGTKVTVIAHEDAWLEISEPRPGFVRGVDLSPFRPRGGRSDFAR